MRGVGAVVVTCEHAGNRVPREYAGLFMGRGRLLGSHRGYDHGALGLARAIAGGVGAPLRYCAVTRLLVEVNRSERGRGLFSEVTRGLGASERERILARWYRPYREGVEALIGEAVRARGRVLHLSVHSFTPVLDGVVRGADVGLLYDPSRAGERALCRRWGEAIGGADPALRVRFNYPYRGVADGFTTWLRGRYPARAYLGVELEVNQALLAGGLATRRRVHATLVESLRGVLGLAPGGGAHGGARAGRRTGASDGQRRRR